MGKAKNRYTQLLEDIFFKKYKRGVKEIHFLRDDILDSAKKLKIVLPKNVGDLIYAFRYRTPLPESITSLAPPSMEWVIRLDGQGRYKFSLAKYSRIAPNYHLAETKIPDATPGVIQRYALGDEQALLAILRYNRLIDIFLGITCYPLQSHLRTTVPGIGQIETDEIYIGLDKRGVHYVVPVQAKGGTDQLGIVQMEQDFVLCEAKFPCLVCIPVAAQFMDDGQVAIFSFEKSCSGEISVTSEKHYRLVEKIFPTWDEIEQYKTRNELRASLKILCPMEKNYPSRLLMFFNMF